MRRPFLFLFLLALIPGYFINQRRSNRDIFTSICQLADEKFYRRDSDVIAWVDRCFAAANEIGFRAGREILVRAIQDQMDEMHASHFQIYNPDEDRQLWKGEILDTGIRSRYVEDKLLVYRVMPKTSAEENGVAAGDEVLAIEGAEQVTPWGAQHRQGRFLFVRLGERLEKRLSVRRVVEDQSFKLTELDGGTALLEIPSFRSDFFEKKKWLELTSRFAKYPHLILDLRENSGGNFVAMLRALSPFFCQPRLIGRIVQPRRMGKGDTDFADELEDQQQLEQLDHSRGLSLRTFSGYGCYQGLVTVLVASDTASTAEIFSEALMHRPNSRVWGQPTSGDVLLGVWYDLPRLGAGYSVSIPEATYLTAAGLELENRGVEPQKTLFHDLKTALAGQDGWIMAAKGNSKKK